jgi:hypothetical protein
VSHIHKLKFKNKIFLRSSGMIVTLYNSDFPLRVRAIRSLECSLTVTEGVHSDTFSGVIFDNV